MDAIGWIDWTLLAVLLLSVLIGLWRGFVFEVLSLLGWVAAYFAAQWYTPLLGTKVPIGMPGSALNQAATFALIFLVAIFVWGLAARLVRLLVKSTMLSPIDRVLGAAFGLLRGALLLLVVTTVVAYTPAARSADWQASHGARVLGAALLQIKPLLPAPVGRHLPGPSS